MGVAGGRHPDLNYSTATNAAFFFILSFPMGLLKKPVPLGSCRMKNRYHSGFQPAAGLCFREPV
jgi:hypothetical protein